MKTVVEFYRSMHPFEKRYYVVFLNAEKKYFIYQDGDNFEKFFNYKNLNDVIFNSNYSYLKTNNYIKVSQDEAFKESNFLKIRVEEILNTKIKSYIAKWKEVDWTL